MSEPLDDENSVRVRTDFYNDIMEAADVGFEIMVQRRMALAKLMNDMPHYPERDASKMKPEVVLAVAGVPLTRDDISMLWRRADEKVKRLATALNARYAPGVGDKYKA